MATKKTVSKAKAVKKKPIARKSGAAAKAKTTGSKPRAKSRVKSGSARSGGAKSGGVKGVDTILTSYERERVSQEAQLATVKKKIKELTTKVAAFEKQIVTLKKQQLDAENAICTLYTRRDQEVMAALAKLGVNLENASALAQGNKKKTDAPTPLFDASEKKAQEAEAKATASKTSD